MDFRVFPDISSGAFTKFRVMLRSLVVLLLPCSSVAALCKCDWVWAVQLYAQRQMLGRQSILDLYQSTVFRKPWLKITLGSYPSSVLALLMSAHE